MEHIVRGSSYPTSKSHVPSLKSSHFLFAVFTITFGFTVIIAGTSALAHYPLALPNPFSEYADIFPGQPESALAARGFLCVDKNNGYYHVHTEMHCTLAPENGDFDMIRLVIYNHIIHETGFFMRDDTLLLGDLVRLFEPSDIKANTHGIVFSWQKNTGVAWTCPGMKGISLFCQIRTIRFMLIEASLILSS